MVIKSIASIAFVAFVCVVMFSIDAAADSATRLRRVGVETIHRTSSSIITVLLPLPETRTGRVLDLNSFDFDSELPRKFTISDGTLLTAFVEVDSTPGSELDKWLNEMEKAVRAKALTEAKTLQLLRTFISTYLKPAPEDWAPGIAKGGASDLPPEFARAASLEVGHFPLETKLKHPVMPLENFLFEKKGACLPKVLLTALIMRKLGIRHRVRSGASEQSGHMWIELPDGRHLDPTWQLLERPSTDGALPGWFRFSQTYLFRNSVFPITVDN